jgi:hypothetical protein
VIGGLRLPRTIEIRIEQLVACRAAQPTPDSESQRDEFGQLIRQITSVEAPLVRLQVGLGQRRIVRLARRRVQRHSEDKDLHRLRSPVFEGVVEVLRPQVPKNRSFAVEGRLKALYR